MTWSLVRQAVQPATLAKYRSCYSEFRQWLDNDVQRGGRQGPVSDMQLDEALSDWVHLMFWQNPRRGNLSRCKSTKHWFGLFLPHLKLVWMAQALRGWDNFVPAQPSTPVPRGLMLLMVRHLLHNNDLEAATAIALSFECYLRTQKELLPAKVSDVALPRDPHTAHWMGTENGILRINGKTGSNQSVLLHPAAVSSALLRRLIQVRQHQGFPQLFYMGDQYRTVFYDTLVALGVSPDAFQPYALKHGGATHDFMLGWSIPDIQVRGRWQRTKNVSHYIQVGQAMLATFQMPPAFQQLAAQLVADPWLVFS